MEVDQIQCKFPKISNGGYTSAIVSQRERMDDDEEEGENRRSNPNNGGSGGAADPGGGVVGLYGWPSSRIVRVSRATGGKDRHSKVLTSRGLRDRRVRLSVNTAIEFYDLQDRLGYDQPSKAVEWLLAAAASSIAELPPMNSPFPLTCKRLNEEENMSASTAADRRLITHDSVIDGGGDGGIRNRGGAQQEAAAAAKSSVGSSSSETSKGSGTSISRSDNRFRAREKANEREIEKSSYVASFTELLNGGGISYFNGGGKEVSVCGDQRPTNDENSDRQSNFFHKFPMNYFNSGLSVPPAAASPAQIAAPLMFSTAADHNHELQPFSFTSDHVVSAVNAANSSAINRGTLQSNSSSPSSLHFPPNFFGGGGATPAGNHRHFFSGFDARLHLCYGDAEGNEGRHSGPKRKGKP